jgi:hypothetical protein
MKVKLIQNFYQPEQTAHFLTGATPHDNRGKLTAYFENSLIANAEVPDDCDYFGVASWKLKEKANSQGIVLESVDQIAEGIEVLGRPDVITFQKAAGLGIHHNTFYHVNREREYEPVFERVFGKPNKTTQPIYANHFIAKAQLFRDYQARIRQAIELCETDPEINKAMYARCPPMTAYGKLPTPEGLGGGIGYPAATFYFEAFAMSYFNTRQYKVKTFDTTLINLLAMPDVDEHGKLNPVKGEAMIKILRNLYPTSQHTEEVKRYIMSVVVPLYLTTFRKKPYLCSGTCYAKITRELLNAQHGKQAIRK